MSSNTDQERVAQLDVEYQGAVEANDFAKRDRILADDFVLITGLGRAYSIADLLSGTKSRAGPILETGGNRQGQFGSGGDNAAVTARLNSLRTLEGNEFDYEVWYSDIYVRTQAEWKYVLCQALNRLPLEGERWANCLGAGISSL
jgi:hypothetical protein